MSYELPPALFDWLGYLGVALYLGSYGLLQAGIIRGSSYVYALLNLAAAAFVLASLTVSFNLSSAMIQVSWIVISIVGLIRLVFLNSSVRFSAEESALLGTVFPDMPKSIARRMLNQGNWISASENTEITTEGAPVNHLFFLHEGEARVLSAGVEVGRLSKGLIGEMNVMQKGAASATVTTSEKCRLFTISGDVLNKLCARDADFRILLENGMSRDTGRKLHVANRKLSQGAGQVGS